MELRDLPFHGSDIGIDTDSFTKKKKYENVMRDEGQRNAAFLHYWVISLPTPKRYYFNHRVALVAVLGEREIGGKVSKV